MSLLNVPLRDLFRRKKKVEHGQQPVSTTAPQPTQYRGATVGDLITITVFVVLFALVGWLMYSARSRTVTPEEMDIYRLVYPQFCWVAVAVAVKTLGSTVGQMFGMGGFGGYGGYGGMIPQQPAYQQPGTGTTPPADPFGSFGGGVMAMSGSGEGVKALSAEALSDPVVTGGEGPPDKPIDVHGG